MYYGLYSWSAYSGLAEEVNYGRQIVPEVNIVQGLSRQAAGIRISNCLFQQLSLQLSKSAAVKMAWFSAATMLMPLAANKQLANVVIADAACGNYWDNNGKIITVLHKH